MQQVRPFGFIINHVARQLERRMADALRPLQLTPAYLPVMISLAESQPRTQSELATTLDIRQPTMAQTLSRMERDGLISRTADTHDRRAVAIMLTDKSVGLLGEIQTLARQISDDALEDIPAARAVQLMADLQTIASHLSRHT